MKNKKENLVLLHGLLGGLSNFGETIAYFYKDYAVYAPELPIFTSSFDDLRNKGINLFVEWLEGYRKENKLESMHLLGNSLGGHVALKYALIHLESVDSLILTGSSGAYESPLGGGLPRRGDREYIRKQAERVFFAKKHVTEELIDSVLERTRSIQDCLKLVAIAKSATRENLIDSSRYILSPTLLVWGAQDYVTPVEQSGMKFENKMQQAKLEIIDACGHAPMMEQPQKFNEIVSAFLKEVTVPT